MWLLSGVTMTAFARDLTEIQEDYLDLKFGMFIHFNMSTFVPGGWSSGKEDPLLFNPTEMDFGQWADAAAAAKMKYAILTVKHTGGWCLWDTATADRDITWFKNYKGGKGDMVKEFTESFRLRGLKVGLYYCFPLWAGDDRWKDYQTLPTEDYTSESFEALPMIKEHFSELLSNYGEIDIIWIDQSSSPHGGLKEGDWLAVKEHIHSLQPDCVVVANNQTDFNSTDIHGYEYPYSLELPKPGNQNPTEVCDKLNQGWFSNPEAPAVPVRTADYVVNKMLRPLNDNNANLLLNCAPDTRGQLHEETVAMLEEIGSMWDPDEPSQVQNVLYGINRSPVKTVKTKKPEIAVTFGPSWKPDEMQEAANILASHNARGTFFLNESLAKSGKGMLRDLVDDGHELGNGSKSDQSITGLANARLVRNEVDAVQKQLRTIQSPRMFLTPGYQYDDYTWMVLNYLGLTALEASAYRAGEVKLIPGSIIDVLNLDDLNHLLKAIDSKNLKAVTVSELFANSTSKRLSTFVNGSGANVVTGRE